MNKKLLIKKLKDAGFEKVREGKHEIWSNGQQRIPIPRHTDINEHTAKEIMKRAGIK